MFGLLSPALLCRGCKVIVLFSAQEGFALHLLFSRHHFSTIGVLKIRAVFCLREHRKKFFYHLLKKLVCL